MIDQFTESEFKFALEERGYEVGEVYLEKGEVCFDLPYKGVNIHVRSSIGTNGRSDGTGENSIRVYMRAGKEWLGKIDAYTTRIPGWANRLSEKVDMLRHYRDLSGDCPVCKQPMGVYKVKKKNDNQGRLFARCEQDDVFVWLDSESNREREILFNTVNVGGGVFEAVLEQLSVEELVVEPPLDVSLTLEQLLAMLPDDEAPQKGEPNAFQKEIIDAPLDQPLRVLAGPGSGKTTTITYRYTHMVVDLQIVPTEIVVVTFNKLAAENMLKKIVEQCPIPPEAMNQISTIHALCTRALRSYYKDIGKLNIAPTYVLEKTLKGLLVKLEPVEDSRPGWEEMLAWINTSKAHGIVGVATANWFMGVNPDLHSSIGKLVQACRMGLDEALRADAKWTFNDMLYEMERALLTDSAFKAHWQRKFNYLIVDEAQDTAAQAIRILTNLFDHTNQILMVGDGDQLLYRFTGATPENTLYEGFDERYPVNQTFLLPVNYRSTRKIVAYSKSVILNNYEPLGAYQARYFKNMQPTPTAASGADLVLTSSVNAISEAHNVLSMVKQFMDEGRSAGDFFIAARTRAQVGYLEAAFAPSSIPYVNVVGTSFFDLPHIKHVLSYMQVVADPRNSAAFANIYNVASANMKMPWSSSPEYGDYCQHRFLTAEFLAAAKHYYGMQELMSYHMAVKPKPSWKPGIQDILELMYELQAAAEEGPAALVTAIVDNCYRKYVVSQTGSEEGVNEGGRLDDINTIKDLASSFTNLQDFIQYADNIIAASKAAQNKDWDGRVVLATIHRLKGLERPIVMGVGISEGADGQSGLLPHTFALIDPPNNGKLPGNSRGRVADERCLLFVLISRAQEMVVLSSLDSYREKPMIPSRFLEELNID